MKSMVSWFQVPCSDFSRAVGFYNKIFDIAMIETKDPADNDMAMFFPPDQGIAGAINSDPTLKPGQEGTRIFLNADGNLDEVLGRVEGAGGQVVAPKMQIENWGFIAMIVDSEGNLVGLHSN